MNQRFRFGRRQNNHSSSTHRYVWGGIIFVIILWWFGFFGSSSYSTYTLPETITFAGKEVPMTDKKTYERIDLAFQLLVHDQRGQIEIWLKRLNKYRTTLESILKKKGMHEDFVYLAVKESSLLPCPISSANARGMWQFIPDTAKRYQLEIDDIVDERCDIKKATVAAAEYLNTLLSNEFFDGDVFLAMAAYNDGEGDVLSMTHSQDNFKKKLGYFSSFTNNETFHYVPGIIALKVILENPRSYGFSIPDGYEEYNLNTHTAYITKDLNIKDLIQALEIDFLTFKNANPHFPVTYTKDNILTKERSYNFYLPAEKIDVLKQFLSQM